MLPLSHMGITAAIICGIERIQLIRGVNYRWVLFGSMLPDIMDKPLKWLFWKGSSLLSGRFFGHTLLLVGILLCLGMMFWMKFNNKNVLVIALCCFVHDLLDAMWLFREIFYWPIFGMAFYPIDHEPWWIAMPYSLIPEVICGIFFLALIARYFKFGVTKR